MTPPASFPWPVLRAPLSPRARKALQAQLGALLRWHETLTRWPGLGSGPDAMPFVSLYAGGRVRGCYGSAEGGPGERIARAFLRAATDARFGPVPVAERAQLAASVSYAIAPRAALRGDDVLAVLEPGTHGAVLARQGAAAAVLLPQVARDGGLDAPAFLGTLARKVGLTPDEWRDHDVLLFEADTVGSRDLAPTRADAPTLAATWLADQVGRDGAVCFAVDAGTAVRQARGPMFHGRACTLVQALATMPRGARPAARRYAAAAGLARRWLANELQAGLAGRSIDAWPDEPSMVAGTLALAVRAGIDVRAELLALVRGTPAATSSGWHAAQVAAALGADTPPHVWRAAVADLTQRPFAPWTLIAAQARGDAAVTGRCERALVDALRSDAPHRGGAAVTSVPETALTAVAVEALAPLAPRSGAARAAVARGRAFLTRWQCAPGRIPAALDPALASGAFPASPVHHALRCDITAHALLALVAR